jgi:superfamily I DNA/RNA helicase
VTTLSPEQAAAAAHSGGNAYVGAGPGTGKTFLLIERLRTLLARGTAPDRILVLTFSRRAVGELRTRIDEADLTKQTIDVRTFHGFAARVSGGGLARFRELRLIDDFSRRLVLDSAIARTPTPSIADRPRTSESFVDEMLSLIDDLDRTDGSTRARVAEQASPRLHDVLAIRDCFARELRAFGAGDLGDLVGRAVAEYQRKDSPAQEWLTGRYDYVLVDEFQDADRQQLALLECCNAEIFAVGDEAQSIYRFRGANDAIVPYAIGRFAMKRYDLSVSRRCPPAVCELASQTPLPSLAPLVSAEGDGLPVDVRHYVTVDAEAFAIADEIESEINAGRRANEIAVLLRAYRPLGPLIAMELARREIVVASSGSEALAGDPAVATLIATLNLFAEPNDRSRWADALASPTLGLDPLAVRFILSRHQLKFDASLAEALLSVMPDRVERVRQLCNALLAAHAAWVSGDLGRCARRIARRMGLIASILRDASPASVRDLAGRLKAVCGALASAQRTARTLGLPHAPARIVERIDDILASLRSSDASVDAPGVRIITIHAAKGLGFERVFIADAVQGRFPREPRASSLLSEGDRALLREHGIDGVTIVPDGAIREEMSLWFVAVTRCSRQLSISFAERDLSGAIQRPSRFLGTRSDVVVTNVSMRSLLVDILESADSATRARLFAAGVVDEVPVVAALARDGAHAFAAFDGPALTRTRPFSVSEATDWLSCPRSVLYGRILRLSQPDSAALRLGSAIHDVLRRFHETYVTFDGSDVDVERWIDELVAIRVATWEASQYESEALSIAAARAADVALRSYAIALEAYARQHPFSVEQREYDVSIPIGASTLTGRIDRLDRRSDGTRVIVDYKSGAAKPSPVKAAEKIARSWSESEAAGGEKDTLTGALPKDLDLQLAFYATAIDDVTTVAKMYLGGDEKTEKRTGIAAVDAAAYVGALETVALGALAELERDALLPLATQGMARVPVATDEKTCEWCAFTRVCPGPAQ